MLDPVAEIVEAERRLLAGDRAGALSRARRILASGSDVGPAWANVTWLCEQIGDYEAALQAARRYFEIEYSNPVAALKVAELLDETGRADQALAIAASLAEQRPMDAAPSHFAGVYRGRLGDPEGGIRSLRRALAAKPDLTAAWLETARLKTFNADDPDLAKMEALLASLEGAGPDLRAPLLYALGKAWEDTGDPERAFSRIAEGARLMSAEQPWDRRRFLSAVEAQVAGIDEAFMARQRQSAVESDRPIFLAGGPGSGAELVEAVLARHSGVRAGGELEIFRLAAAPIGDATPAIIDAYVQTAGRAGSPDIWTGFGANYLSFLDERFGFEDRILDRSPSLVTSLGAVALALPKAALIWVRRDPRDAAWAAFKAFEPRGRDWSWSLADTAAYLAGVERLHARWSGTLGERLLTLDYEAFVERPEAILPAILAHTGLADEPSLHAPLADAAAASVGAWKSHARGMQPFLNALERAKA